MANVDRPKQAKSSPQAIEADERAVKLISEMLAGNVIDFRPQVDFATELGFSYPAAEKILELTPEETLSTLESLVAKGVLKKAFFDKLLRCPNCQSPNLMPNTHCPKCGSANVGRGRILEHSVCKYVGLEGEFVSRGRYVCPKCGQELHTIGSDYQSLGLLRKCHDCEEVFGAPVIKWRCVRCSTISAEDKVTEVHIFSYGFDEAKRGWLQFELQPKAQLIEFLKQYGYEVTENAKVKGRSGAEHSIDILATKDDGVVAYDIAIGVRVVGEEIGLDQVFDFDGIAYDAGIHDKIMIVVPGLAREAEKFASQQRIKVLEVRDLETVLAGTPRLQEELQRQPFVFKSKSQLIQHLKQLGYEVKENAEVKGKSGAAHILDILATKDDGIVYHHIAIGVEVAEGPVALDELFAFDDKAYDIGILDRVFIAVPRLSPEARQFAQRQRIKVFEVNELEPSS